MPDPTHGTSGPSRYDLGWLGGDVGRGNHLMVCMSVSFYLVHISLFAAFSSSSFFLLAVVKSCFRRVFFPVVALAFVVGRCLN